MSRTKQRTDHQASLHWWRGQIRRQQNTKVTVAEFCRQLGVSQVTF